MNGQFWWFMARASGMVAWGFLTASVLWGIVLASGLFPKHRRPAWLLDLHRWLGGLTVSFVMMHVAALIADSYVTFDLADVLVPFASAWKTGAVALGVIAMWGLVAVEATSLAKKRLPREVWRSVHLTSYVTFFLSSLHGTFAGTDATQPMYVATSTVTVLAVTAAFVARTFVGRRRRQADVPSRRAVV